MALKTYIILLRGVNVGGKNKVPMTALRDCLEELGFADVTTYIASGNAVLRSSKSAVEIQSLIENALPKRFELDSDIIRVLVLTRKELQAIVTNKPKGFGTKPQLHHSDAIFLIGVSAVAAMSTFDPREGVDRIWKGKGVIYSERLSALRTKSRLNKIVQSPFYKSMTIRNWNTTVKLLDIANTTDNL
jgi:uncharacterized protein (DUF1697 family)